MYICFVDEVPSIHVAAANHHTSFQYVNILYFSQCEKKMPTSISTTKHDILYMCVYTLEPREKIYCLNGFHPLRQWILLFMLLLMPLVNTYCTLLPRVALMCIFHQSMIFWTDIELLHLIYCMDSLHNCLKAQMITTTMKLNNTNQSPECTSALNGELLC